MTTHSNDMTHATHDLKTEAIRLKQSQGFNAAGARKLARQYLERHPETAKFFEDMATYYEEN
jgi:hypothetical protein